MQHVGTKQLETERLILRRYQLNDAEDMFENWVTDEEAARFWEWTTHKDISETISFLKQWISEYSNNDYYHWVIINKSQNKAVGYIYLNSINNDEKSAAVHYLLSRNLWNQGFMTEACKRVIMFAFDEVGFQKIVSYHHINNPASVRVMQKCGMKFIKTEYRNSDHCNLNGEYHYYEITQKIMQ